MVAVTMNIFTSAKFAEPGLSVIAVERGRRRTRFFSILFLFRNENIIFGSGGMYQAENSANNALVRTQLPLRSTDWTLGSRP